MAKALVVTHRDHLLPAVLQALAGGALVIEPDRSIESARARLGADPPALLVIDYASLPEAELAGVPNLAADAAGAAVVAVVNADHPRLLRAAIELPADAVLLDPLDLTAAASALDRVLRRRDATAREGDSLDGLSTFLRGLAHEILNPLFPINAFLQILQRDPALPPELKDRYDKMLEGTRRIEKTVRDLECFARVRKPQRALLDLAELLRELAGRWRAQTPPLDLTVEAPATTPRVLADREQLAIALHHLAAFAAGGERLAPVELIARIAGQRVELAIVGHVEVKLPPRPADAFLPYHDNQGAGRPGTLELAAAWGILKSHRAGLVVEPLRPCGVCFNVSFPVTALRSDPASEPPAEPRINA